MSRMVVARTGLGRLHIAAPMPGGSLATICGRTLTRDVKTWRAGRQATAIWQQWQHCATCAELNQKWGR